MGHLKLLQVACAAGLLLAGCSSTDSGNQPGGIVSDQGASSPASAASSFPTLPAGAVLVTESGQRQVLSELAAKPGHHNFMRGAGDRADERGLKLTVTAIARNDLGRTSTYTATLTGQQGRLVINHLNPPALLDTEVLWMPSGFYRRAWNQPRLVQASLASMEGDLPARLAPAIFVDLQDRWTVASVATAVTGTANLAIVDAEPLDQTHPFNAARIYIDRASGLPARAWFRSRHDGATCEVVYRHGRLATGEAAMVGLDMTADDVNVIARFTSIETVPMSAVPNASELATLWN
jgi:hypothetical protein